MRLGAKNGPPRRSHVLLVEVLHVHPVNSVNIINEKFSMLSLNETADLSKFIAGLLIRELGAMFSYFIFTSHSYVSDPGPESPLVVTCFN